MSSDINIRSFNFSDLKADNTIGYIHNGINLEEDNGHVTLKYNKEQEPVYCFASDWNRLTRKDFVINIDHNCEARLSTYTDGYKLLFNTLVHNHPDQKDIWNVLLSVNSNDYRKTVLEIETSLDENKNE